MTIITLLVIGSLIIIDQLSKIGASATLSQGRDILLWENVFHLSYVENRGAAFGMLQGKQWFFILMTIIVLVGIVIYFKKIPETPSGKWMKFSFTLIIAGAIGNLIDRIILNYVRDFLYFSLIDFPVFNFADSYVVIGTSILLLVIIFGEIEAPHKVEE